MGFTVIRDGVRACIKCGEDKPISQFYSYSYTNRQGRRGKRLDSRCVPCARSRRKADYATNAESRKATARAYKAAQGERLLDKVRAYRAQNRDKWLLQKRAYEQKRRANANLDSADAVRLVELVLEEARVGDRYVDAYTGDLISDPEVDHIVPLAAGGRHEYDNLCVTSGANNRSKRDTPLLAWMARKAA